MVYCFMSLKIFIRFCTAKSDFFCTFAPSNQISTNLNSIQKMAYVISEDCMACGTCAGECPNEAITEGDIYHIDPDKCVDCGTCASVCPAEAIKQA